MDGSSTTRVRRRFAISDAMTLIAASAVALTCNAQSWSRIGLVAASPGSTDDRLYMSVVAALPWLVAWTVAVFLLRIRGPRPPWRRVSTKGDRSS